MSGKTRHDNPTVLLSRVAIYWIGGLLGLVVLAGCKSDRFNERGQPFLAADASSTLIVLGKPFGNAGRQLEGLAPHDVGDLHRGPLAAACRLNPART